MKKRLFVAIEFPAQVKKQIGEVVENLKKKYPEIRWEREENLHLTLKFLGWVEGEVKSQNSKVKSAIQKSKVEAIIAGMGKGVEGIRPFWFRPTKVGYFLRESLIVWLGIEEEAEIFKLVGKLENEMEKIGFPKEKRPFTSHITLGRKRQAYPISDWHKIAQELQNLKTPEFERFRVEQIVLMESHLTLRGSNYTILKAQYLLC